MLVVYRPFPTSNHNVVSGWHGCKELYIVRFLHQTTTLSCAWTDNQSCISSVSYIKPQPAVLDVFVIARCISSVSYIKPQLQALTLPIKLGCISSVSYIKPQRNEDFLSRPRVVYRPFPTSNHNLYMRRCLTLKVVYRPFPTSNHNYS